MLRLIIASKVMAVLKGSHLYYCGVKKGIHIYGSVTQDTVTLH